MPQPERPVLLRAPAGDARSLQTELPNEELGYLQSRPQHFDAVAGFEHAEFGEVVQPRLEGVETLGERVVDLLLIPSSRPIAPLVGERLRLRRRRARRRRDGGRRRNRRRGRGRRRGGRGSRRRARRRIVAGERRRGRSWRRRRLRRERWRSGGRRRSGRLDGCRRVVSLSRAGEDAYGGGDDGERQQDGAPHLAARRTAPCAVRPLALPTSRGRSVCPVAGRIIALTVGAGESRLMVFPFPLAPFPLFLLLLLAAFALLLLPALLLLLFTTFPLRLLAALALRPFAALALRPFTALALRLLAAVALRPFVRSSMRRLPRADRSPSLAKRARRSRADALRAEEQGTRLGYFLHPRRGVGSLVPIGMMLQRLPAKRLRYLFGRSP